MFASKMLCIFVLLCAACNTRSATVSPPPIIQTLGQPDATNPEYVPLANQLPNMNAINGTKAINSTMDKKDENHERIVQDAKYWHKIAVNQLEQTIKSAKRLKDTSQHNKAKNIIIFVGDGMGLTTITAGRIYKGQYLKHGYGEEEMLSFDHFPHIGLSKTYNVDKQVPDSAGTATAMFCGSKSDYGAIGMDTTRSETSNTQGKLQSIMDWAQAEGKRTGVVTTTRITHATPAATYARIYNRDWECDTKVPAKSKGIHIDIAAQLVENAPGNKLNVIMGGGLSPMGALNEQETSTIKFEGGTEKICTRGDGRNLTREWLRLGAGKEKRVFVQTREQLQSVDLKKVDNLMGLFRNNHITYAIARQPGEPSLQEMTEAAIDVLERGKDSKGFVLLVEGGRIDQAHHQNYARAAMHEVLELDKAVQAAVDRTGDDTLIMVTADHSHAVTLNGYPKRGNNILGFASKDNDPIVYETLTYANGPGFWDHLANGSVGAEAAKIFVPLESLSDQQRGSPTYRHMATLPLVDETHGGEDVIVFAAGPGASLVRGVFEQNYLAYVMSYAGCMGPAKDFDESCKPHSNLGTGNSASQGVTFSATLLLCLMVVLNLFHL